MKYKRQIGIMLLCMALWMRSLWQSADNRCRICDRGVACESERTVEAGVKK